MTKTVTVDKDGLIKIDGGLPTVEINFEHFDEDEVHVTFISDIKNFEFAAGFNKPVFAGPKGTRFASLEREDNYNTVATAAWLSRKELEITMRLIGCPAIVKVVADFSLEENPVKIVPVRSRKK